MNRLLKETAVFGLAVLLSTGSIFAATKKTVTTTTTTTTTVDDSDSKTNKQDRDKRNLEKDNSKAVGDFKEPEPKKQENNGPKYSLKDEPKRKDPHEKCTSTKCYAKDKDNCPKANKGKKVKSNGKDDSKLTKKAGPEEKEQQVKDTKTRKKLTETKTSSSDKLPAKKSAVY